MTNKPTDHIEIKHLADVPEHIPTLAQWTYDAWGRYDPTISVVGTIKKLHEELNKQNIPLVFVAIYNGLPIATVTLKDKIPVAGYEDRDLWLGSFFVSEGHRNKGVGTQILEYAYTQAKALGYSKISLFTSDRTAAEWYVKHGWKIFARDSYHNHPVTLLEFLFSN